MITTLRFVRRRPGLSPDEFKWGWLGGHAALLRSIAAVAPVAGATASFTTTAQIADYGDGSRPPETVDFDGVEQLYFATMADLREVVSSGALAAITADQAGWADPTRPCERTVMLEDVMARRAERDDAETRRLKFIRTVQRKPGLDLFEFRDHWHNHHRHLESHSIRLGPTYRINVMFAMNQVIVVDGADVTVKEGDGVVDGVVNLYTLTGTDIPQLYARRTFRPEVRRDEERMIDVDAAFYRAVLDEFTIVDHRDT